MNSVKLLELVRKAGVVINGHDELVAIEEFAALVERETTQSGSARARSDLLTHAADIIEREAGDLLEDALYETDLDEQEHLDMIETARALRKAAKDYPSP